MCGWLGIQIILAGEVCLFVGEGVVRLYGVHCIIVCTVNLLIQEQLRTLNEAFPGVPSAHSPVVLQ